MTYKKFEFVIQIKGWLLVSLGIIHSLVALLLEYDRALGHMTKEFANEYILWFLLVGILIAFFGIIDLLTCRSVAKNNTIIDKVSFSSAILLFMCGSMGIIVYKGALGPQYVLFILGAIHITYYLIVKNSKNIQKEV